MLFLLVPVLAVVCCELDGEDQMENLNDIKVKISCKNGCLEKTKKILRKLKPKWALAVVCCVHQTKGQEKAQAVVCCDAISEGTSCGMLCAS